MTSLDPYIAEAEKTRSVVKALSLANYYRNHTTDQDCQAIERLCRAKTYQEDSLDTYLDLPEFLNVLDRVNSATLFLSSQKTLVKAIK